MAYLKFDKTKLVNLEYSLDKEILRTNRAGSYSLSTIVGCNTRKYHGLLVCPIDSFGGEKHVLLSSLDETIIQHDSEFHLGIHKFANDYYSPRGHKYIIDFEMKTIPRVVYQVGGVVLSKESLFVLRKEQLLLKYTLEDAHSQTKLKFRPFLAFRNIHGLCKANLFANTKYENIENGIKICLYSGFPYLHLQFSKPVEFVPVPDWYYNIEYPREQERGYDYKEDLYVPGYFELDIKKGETIYFSASTEECSTKRMDALFTKELGFRIPQDSFKNCLINAAKQFKVELGNETEIVAGYPWFGSWGRDTFIALPGLSLAIGNVELCRSVIDTMIPRMKDGLFPNMGNKENPAFNSVDAPLWFFWTIQQLGEHTGENSQLWKKYGNTMKAVLEGYKKGLPYNIQMHSNGLIFAGEPSKALTWMDAVVDGKPVTPRTGFDVEINALWYNAICYALDIAKKAKDQAFVDEWKSWPELIENSFVQMFWDPSKNYLADYVNDGHKDWAIRPNQIIATSLPFSPLNDEMKMGVIDIVLKELLTPRGLRTLSPQDPQYKGICEGNQRERDLAYHQGTVWTWLLEPFCRGYLDVYKNCAIPLIKKLYEGFEEEMNQKGIGTISEIYNGNPPHQAGGTISQAWSVAALLRINEMIENYESL